MKLFFGYRKYDSVTGILLKTGLPIVLIQFAIMPSVLFKKGGCPATIPWLQCCSHVSCWSLTGTTVTDTMYMFHTVNGGITRVTGFILSCLSLYDIVLHFSLLLLL